MSRPFSLFREVECLSRACIFSATIRLTLDERAVSLPHGPATVLLAYLALHSTQDRSVPRSRLAGVLWPDLPEARARRNLATAICPWLRWSASGKSECSRPAGFSTKMIVPTRLD